MCIHTKQSCIHTTVYVPVRVNTQCQSINFGKLKYFWETKRGVCPPCMYHTNIRARKYPISTTKLEKKVEVRLNLTQKANNENPVRTTKLVSLKAPRLPEEWLRYCRCCCSWWSSSFLLSWKSVCVCSSRETAFFPPVDIQHTQCPRWVFTLERYKLWSQALITETTTQATTM